MAGVRQLQGEPWHLERMHRADGDEKRHRSRCIFYSKIDKRCSQYLEPCHGTAHCPYYDEQVHVEPEVNVINVKKDNMKIPSLFRKYDRVNHRKFGDGIVTDVDKNRVSVRFDSGKESKFDVKTCIDKKLMTLASRGGNIVWARKRI